MRTRVVQREPREFLIRRVEKLEQFLIPRVERLEERVRALERVNDHLLTVLKNVDGRVKVLEGGFEVNPSPTIGWGDVISELVKVLQKYGAEKR